MPPPPTHGRSSARSSVAHGCVLAATLALVACDPARNVPLPDRGRRTEAAARPPPSGSTLETATSSRVSEFEEPATAPSSAAPSSGAGRASPPRDGGNSTTASFSAAKRALATIYADHRTTIYCDCAFDQKLRLREAGCSYRSQKRGARAKRVEWEHVVPAEAFGRSFAEWREGHPDCVDRKGKAFRGRQCARKVSQDFRLIEADLYNLYPAIGELNGLRSNFAMAEIEGEERAFGGCDAEILDRKFEPRASVKGEVARTYFYMDQAYPGRGIVSGKNRKLFTAWSELDPVDDWECQRAERIAKVQGNRNAVVAAACERRH